MSDKLYELMDWAEMEAVVYSEESLPRKILGPRLLNEGVLIQCFFPERKRVTIKTLSDGKCYPMVREDSAGFFACLLKGRKVPEYVYLVEESDGVREYYDAYAFPTQIMPEEERKFSHGIWYQVYEKLGAHPMRINGVDGVYFAVWAPNALRVSVVGDFNQWDGRMYQMQKLPDSGIFELFIPQVPVGALYKFELKLYDGLTYLKADPYANAAELRPATASIVADIQQFRWHDSAWMKRREKTRWDAAPVMIYEMHLGSWKKPEDGREFYNYRELAPLLIDYLKEMGYTHVELMPVMEHPYDGSWGYQATGYYAPTSRYGSPEDFMYFVDALHQAGFGVILDWVPAHFPRDIFGLSSFDGTCLYEHRDPRKGAHPQWGTLIFNYGRPQVRNFLMGSALFWADQYHADGLRFDAVASMLYLDYGRREGEWVANLYGGNENLEAEDFLKQLNVVFKKKHPGAFLIAEGSTAWPRVTGPVDEDGLGFDFKWNMGWLNDFIGYMRCDPYFRGDRHNDLTFSMIYAYSERFILSLSHDEVVHAKGSLIGKMPGSEANRFANLRAALGYFMTHPGKKLLFMGQEFAQLREWSENRALDWNLLNETGHRQMQSFVKALIDLYRNHPALYSLDYDPEGFEWINCVDWEKNLISFMRKSEKAEDTLVVLCNFSDVRYPEHRIGVPYPGNYKEVLNSDAVEFGGGGRVNPRVKIARKEEQDDRPYSLCIDVAPLCAAVFTYTKMEQKAADNQTAKKKVPAQTRKGKDLKKRLQDQIAQEERE